MPKLMSKWKRRHRGPVTKLVGLGGHGLAGKDVVARRLEGRYGWKRTYFSAGLEQALLKLNPLIPTGHEWWSSDEGVECFIDDHEGDVVPYAEMHEAIGYDRSKQNTEVRRFLQILGTDIGRDMCDADVWLRWAFRKVDEDAARGYNVAITGVRFSNEMAAIKARGGLTVWVDRGFGPVNDHVSDNTLNRNDFDMILLNDGTLEDLYAKVDELADLIAIEGLEARLAA